MMTRETAFLALISLHAGSAQSAEPAAAKAEISASASDEASAGPVAPEGQVALTGDAEGDSESKPGSLPVSTVRPASPPSYAGLRATRRLPDGGEANEPYLSRFVPESNLWEVGLFTGLFVPAFDHNLKVASLPHQAYKDLNLTLGARLAYFPLSFVGVEAEASVTPSATRQTNKSALLYAARGHLILQLPMLSLTPFGLFGAGILGAVSEPLGHDGDPAIHFGIGVKAPVSRIVSLRLDLRDTLTQQGRGAASGSPAHHFEALLGATFTFERTPKTRPVPDADYDGLYDSEDSCPDLGALTLDGCPQGTDADGDGFLDGDDLCPTERGAPGSDCPAPGPGEPAPPVPSTQTPSCGSDEILEASGCSPVDADQDSIRLPDDRCPTEPETKNGFEDADGCPDAVPDAIKQFTGVIQGISFKKGQSEISADSFPVLDRAADVMREHSTIRLEVSGHTSSEGRLRENQRLSEARARAVADYLKSKGVPESQITVRGAGSSEPIADNSTLAGREQNRRIEFRVLTQ
jgi:OmpA-OmpF porin, OOP family